MFNLLQNAKRLSLLKLSQRLPNYRRFLFDTIFSGSAKITGIYGARGVGKSTLMLQILQNKTMESDKLLYISCDHPMFKEVSLFDFVDEFVKRGGEFLVIDEIHEAEDFQTHLKSVYDFLDVKILFSGSSAIEITNPDFARRYSMYKMPILSFREYLEMSQNIILKSYSLDDILKEHERFSHTVIQTMKEKKILKYFDLFLNEGCYPFYFEDPAKYLDRINETINTVLYKDLGRLFNIQPQKIDTLKKLLLTVCVSQPFELSIEKLATTAGISKVTLYKYLDYLSRGELIHLVRHEAKRFKSMRKPDKLYLANTNLFPALCMGRKRGTVRETFFVSMLHFEHSLYYPEKGDLLIDEHYTVEIGGKKKNFAQIADIANSFLAIDDIELGMEKKIPLWLFGFLY